MGNKRCSDGVVADLEIAVWTIALLFQCDTTVNRVVKDAGGFLLIYFVRASNVRYLNNFTELFTVPKKIAWTLSCILHTVQ